MAELKQACIYGRKSREDASTLENQIASCAEWAEKNGINVVTIFEEKGSASSEDWNRQELQKMLKAIERGDFHYVIVSEQSRISRDGSFSLFSKLMAETETLFILTDSNEIIDFDNASDSLMAGMKQNFNEYELKTTKKRLKRGTVQSAKRGNWQGKKAPIGYDYDKDSKRLVKNKDAAAIEKMFKMYLQGYSTTQISHIFIMENVKAYHKVKGEFVPITWSKSTIARSLKNIAYAGHTIFGKTKLKKVNSKREIIAVDEEDQIIVKDTHAKEAIVTQEEWDQVQEMITKKRFQPPALKHAKHKFSGLIACAKCLKHHTFERQADSKREWRISSCQNRIYNEENYMEYEMCKNSGCKLHIVETLFYSLLEKYEKQIEGYIELVKNRKMLSKNDLENKKAAYIKSQTAKRDHLKNKRRNILDNIEEGFYEGEAKEEKRYQVRMIVAEIREIEAKLEDLEIEQEESETAQIENVLNLIKRFISGRNNPKMSEKEQNEILSEFVEDIYYRKTGRWAEPTIEVMLKSNMKEIMEGIEYNLSNEIA
jgi:site-specific DNA recombinase